MSETQKDRLFELLSDDAFIGLSDEETMELSRLKKQFPEWRDDFSFEMAAAAINLSDFDGGAETSLPANLRAKILTDADDYFNSSAANDVVSTGGARGGDFVQTETAKTSSFFGQWLGWAVAAAACVALAVNLWLTHWQPQMTANREPVKTPEPVQTATPIVALSAAQQREQLIASAPDIVKIDLKAADVKSSEKLSGEVVWSSARQKGFVRFRGLPANDAARETYQLWIVDATRDAKTPVSGGVFDVAENGEIVVPINAQLEIKQPKAFAVSREKAGGVVVSSPERAVAVGKV